MPRAMRSRRANVLAPIASSNLRQLAVPQRGPVCAWPSRATVKEASRPLVDPPDTSRAGMPMWRKAPARLGPRSLPTLRELSHSLREHVKPSVTQVDNRMAREHFGALDAATRRVDVSAVGCAA